MRCAPAGAFWRQGGHKRTQYFQEQPGCLAARLHDQLFRHAFLSITNMWKMLRPAPRTAPAARPQVKVIRGGQQQTVPNYEVVVGDLMLLDTGDKIIADGYVVEVRQAPWLECGLCARPSSLGTPFSPLSRTGSDRRKMDLIPLAGTVLPLRLFAFAVRASHHPSPLPLFPTDARPGGG